MHASVPTLDDGTPGYGTDTAAPLSRAPITEWHRDLLRVLRTGADDGSETRVMVLIGDAMDCAALLGAVVAEGWEWCLSTAESIHEGARLARTVRVVSADRAEIGRLNFQRTWFAGHNVLFWLDGDDPTELYSLAPDLTSWARFVADLRIIDEDYPRSRDSLQFHFFAKTPFLDLLGSEFDGARVAMQGYVCRKVPYNSEIARKSSAFAYALIESLMSICDLGSQSEIGTKISSRVWANGGGNCPSIEPVGSFALLVDAYFRAMGVFENVRGESAPPHEEAGHELLRFITDCVR